MWDSGPRSVRCLTLTWSDRSLKMMPLTSTTTLTTLLGSWKNCVPRSETTKWPNSRPSKKLSPFLSKFLFKIWLSLIITFAGWFFLVYLKSLIFTGVNFHGLRKDIFIKSRSSIFMVWSYLHGWNLVNVIHPKIFIL